jgi:hypothetical protein
MPVIAWRRILRGEVVGICRAHGMNAMPLRTQSRFERECALQGFLRAHKTVN